MCSVVGRGRRGSERGRQELSELGAQPHHGPPLPRQEAQGRHRGRTGGQYRSRQEEEGRQRQGVEKL